MSSQLAFFAADTLGTTLYQVQDRLEAGDSRTLKLGSWRIETPVIVRSDLITGREVTFWVTVGKLPLYLIVRERECWLFVLAAGTTLAPMTGLLERIAELRPAIKAAFAWHGKAFTSREAWKQMMLTEIP